MLPALPIALGLVLAPVLVPVRHAAAQTYSLTILGTLRADGTGNSTARGINDAGVVVGQAAADTGGLHAFRWSAPAGGPGIMADLGRLVVPFETMAQDINTSGSITGFGLTRPEGFGSGFRYAGAPPLVNLRETGGGGDSLAFGIADDGTIVGWSNLQQGCGNPDCMSNPGHAIVWPSGSVIPTRLPELGGYYSAATKISRDGATICGYGAIASGQTRAFRLRAGEGAAPLSPLPGDILRLRRERCRRGGWSVALGGGRIQSGPVDRHRRDRSRSARGRERLLGPGDQ